MSIHFHPLTIKQIRKETPETVSILFDIPEELRAIFTFEPGQSLTMRTSLDGNEIRRSYSICSSPHENEWRVAVKKVEGGLFSAFANETLKAGDVLEVMPPVGKFNTQLNPDHKKNYLAFAAGSGITPVISLIKTILATEPHSRFTLVYGNRNRQSIIFLEELEGLKNKYLSRFHLIHILSREKTEMPISEGRIDLEKVNALSKIIDYKNTDEFFLCGPEEMIFTVKEFLEKTGTDKKNIHFELFTTPDQQNKNQPGNQKENTSIQQSAGETSQVTIKLDGRTFSFDLQKDSATTILDAALQQNADLPYACKGGVCTTCKAKIISGEVKMEMNWGLEDEEVEQGYILTCQSHPITPEVMIDFDVK